MKLWILFPLLLALVQCSTLGGQRSAANAPKQITILFKGKAGQAVETKYFSSAHTRIYEGAQITNERQEIVDFTVATKTVGASDKAITAQVKTIRKDGTVNLHDLAFPELNEEIEFVIQPNGKILKAGQYPPLSIYFVPSLPIPDHPVEVGDTWTLEHQWLSSKDGIPLKLEVVGILKAIVACEGKNLCADIEVSGSVRLEIPPTVTGARFDSRVWGRVLFSLERGDVIWSEMRSQEEMLANTNRTVVSSCMVSQVQMKSAGKVKLECEPGEQAVSSVPSL